MVRSALASALFAAVTAHSTVAAAQANTSLAPNNGDGISTRLFHNAIDSKGFFTVNGTDVLAKGDFALGLILDGGLNVLRLRDKTPDGMTRDPSRLINQQFHGVLMASYSPLKSLTVGVGLPVDLVSGDPQSAAGAAATGGTVVAGQKTDVNSFLAGEYQLNAKYRLTRVEDDPLGVALIVQGEFSPGSDARNGYAADPGLAITPLVALEKRLGFKQQFRIGLNAGATLITGNGSKIGDLAASDVGKPALQHGNLGRGGFAMSYRITDEVDIVAETYASYLFKNDAGGTAGTSAEAVGGLKVFVERNSYLFLGAGAGYLKGYQAADGRAFLGFIFEPSIGDRDGDGIKDDVDKCPDEPEDKDGFQDEDGCPDPDNDQDGIPDKRDACPNDPETKNGIADEDGCPDGIDGDRDHDGIPDSKDKCPDEPEDKDGFQDQDGCPDPDNDNDGILDKDDQCPNDPEDKDGFEDADGCPDPDNDHDGILDKDDKCPNQPETFNGFEDEDGCPDKGKVIIEGSNIIILEKIQFDYNSAKIKTESMPIIDQVAGTLKGHPEFTLVGIEGHADERGNDDYNLQLTQARVNSVLTALTQRGVETKRLLAKGYGEYCPLDPEHNESAWEKNRRVEFKILKTKDGPSNAVPGCPAAAAHNVKLEVPK